MISYFFSTKKYEDELLHGKIDIVKMENTCMVPTHSHEFFEFFYVLDGTATHSMNNSNQILTPGDYAIIDYHSTHSYYNCHNFTIINCLFVPELIDDTFRDVRDFNDLTSRMLFKIDRLRSDVSIANVLYHDSTGRIKNIFKDMHAEYTERNIGCLEILKYLLSQLILITLRQSNHLTDISPFTKTIMEIIDESYNEHITLGDICKTKHYTLAYASSKFKSETGMTFTEYIQKKRISESCILLSETNKSITEIANSVGYSNIKFFNQLFKDITHTTPRLYRQNHLFPIKPK